MPAQPIHQWRLDIGAALEDAAEALELWFTTRRMPGVPAFSGGLMDSWPAWAVDALSICAQEERRVQQHLEAEAMFHG